MTARLLLFTIAPSVTGTTAWRRREIVYDIDDDATLISIGFELEGAGRPGAEPPVAAKESRLRRVAVTG